MCSIQTIAMPAPRELADRRDELVRLGVGEPGADLVEQQQPRLGRERARELEPLAVEQAERLGRPVRERASARRASSDLDAAVRRRRGCAARRRPPTRRRTRSRTPSCRRTAAAPGARGRSRAGSARRRPRVVTSAPREADRAGVRPERAGEDVQQRRLARRRSARRCRRPRRRPTREVDAVEHDERAEALAGPRRRRASAVPSGLIGRSRPLYGFSFACDRDVRVVGVLADDEVELELAPPSALTHWPPMIGVVTTCGTGLRLPPCPSARRADGVSTLRCCDRVGDRALVLRVAALLQRGLRDVEERTSSRRAAGSTACRVVFV